MLALDEGEILGGGQREPRCEQPLRRRVAGEIQEQRRALECAALLEALAKELGAVVRDADAGEHDREVVACASLRTLTQPRVAGDLDGETVVRQSAAGEYRQLLAAHQAVHQVERGDTGLDEVARSRARDRVDGQAFDAAHLARGDRRAAVDHLSDTVEHAAEDRGR